LVVDADPDRRALLEYLIGWLPYRMHAVPDPAAAMVALETLDPGVVLVSLEPEAGPEAAEQRTLFRTCVAAGVPLVTVSDRQAGDSDVAGPRTGVVACLTDPISAKDLAEVLDRWASPAHSLSGAVPAAGTETARRALSDLVSDLGRDGTVTVWIAFTANTAARCAALD